jgi:hypothetical protein
VGRESSLWRVTDKNLSPFGVFERVESSTGTGIADVFYATQARRRRFAGAIELKHVPQWPARPDTPLRVRHLTADQELWHDRWRLGHGVSWLLLQVEREYLLLESCHIAAVREGLCRRELIERAAVWCDTVFPKIAILRALTAEHLLTVDPRY